MENLLLIILLAPAIAAAIAAFVPGAKAARSVAIAGSGLAALASLFLYSKFDSASAGFQFEHTCEWLPKFGINLHLGVDGLSLGLLLLTTFVGFCAVLASDDITKRENGYYAMLLVMIGATSAAFVSLNLFFFYFFAEVATLPKYLLTGVWGQNPGGGSGRSKAFAAIQQTIFIGGGAMAALVALIALYFLGGHTLDVAALTENVAKAGIAEDWQRWIFGGLLFGFGAWVSIVPLHAWSPAAYSAAPTGAAMFFAGVSKKVGAYGLIRIGVALLPAGAHAWAAPLAVLALVNILYGGFVAMRQQDWQPLIGYSSVSHAGYMFLGIAALTPAALNGTVLFMVAHGLMTALLFAMAGATARQTGTREIRGASGLARVFPFTAVLMAMGILASAGVPGFANFASELMIFIGSWQAGTFVMKLATIGAVWGLVVTATYLLRALRNTFYGPVTERLATAKESVGLATRIAAILLVAALLILGLKPRLLTDASAAVIGKFQLLEKPTSKISNDWKATAPTPAQRVENRESRIETESRNEVRDVLVSSISTLVPVSKLDPRLSTLPNGGSR